MGNFGSYIIGQIHINNHFKVKRKALINGSLESLLTDTEYPTNLPRVYRDLDLGLYKLLFVRENEVYFVDVYEPVKGGATLKIYGTNDAIYDNLTRKKDYKLYKDFGKIEDSSKEIKLENTVNSILNMIVFGGYSKNTLEQPSIYLPTDITSRNYLKIETRNDDNSSHDSLAIDLKKDCKSLPNGLRDVAIFNMEEHVYHYIEKVGVEYITGVDEMTYDTLNSTEDYSVFYIRNEHVAFGDDPGNIMCTHLECVSYSTLIDKLYEKNCIAVSDDMITRGPGFFVKVSSSIANDVDSFRVFLNSYRLKNNIMIYYPLAKWNYGIQILDDYTVNTYFGNTFVKTNIDDASIFYKSYR